MRRLSVLLVPLFAACAPAAQTTTDGPVPAAQPVAAAPAGLVGDYTATLAQGDFPASAPLEMRGQLAGSWVIAFHPVDHFVATQNGRQVLEGPYKVSGNQLMFSTGESGPYACNTPATYTWQMNGGQVTFTPVGTDRCEGRALAIASRPFTRRP